MPHRTPFFMGVLAKALESLRTPKLVAFALVLPAGQGLGGLWLLLRRIALPASRFIYNVPLATD